MLQYPTLSPNYPIDGLFTTGGKKMVENYRIPKASKLLGVAKSTLWGYIKQGKIKTKKLSPRVTVIESKELERFMSEEVA
jgi:predicted DNA-binding transcriptional regulator AlpA